MSSASLGYCPPATLNVHAGFTSRALIRLGAALIAAGSRLARPEGPEAALFREHLERRTDASAVAHSGLHLLLWREQ
ncbi:hypothetical protein LJ753_10140 [Arthrobacter sp. zg-Y20]|uniref:hypothetical protein n=1 Tax=unclassified Arthrobacter TaxID=235627 RepID=UPI001D15B89A|nr:MULTISPECIES: hypothetical protein [unclassified Arthrobacter]MCC3276228.1 hypothetical protein [Arthrobacter sp. zg-Y20]MDK1316388.1 hypothetical protein [Arthrobacter sp. zg.Y20]WIB06435.1 hypothetical protein QNO06_01445 [Arthrobacter sp. zg-Y20]